MRSSTCLLASIAALILCACGDDDGDGTSGIAPAPQTPAAERGTLIESPPARIASYSELELLERMGDLDVAADFIRFAYTPRCAIDVHHMRYRTVGAKDEATTASAALMIPSGSNVTCRGRRPILLYARGTKVERDFNIANLENEDNVEGILIAAAFASQGYIVVAPNYAGYDTSELSYHPYLVADQQSKDMIDALAAARSALSTATAPDTSASGELFITGYSQGGYVAMATHRAMQEADMTVTASAPMSGPYALAAFGDAIFQGRVSISAPLNVALLMTGYQDAYGNIYSNASEAFEAPYAEGIDTLLPSATAARDLYAQNRLPQSELFSSTPPDSAFAGFTPATTPTELASVFASGFGPNHLITNGFRLAYLQDAQANPDGGFPTLTTGLPPANPGSAFRQALKLNDLRGWTPAAPMLLCAGREDPTVFYLNTELMQSHWAANAPGAPVTVLDIDSPSDNSDPYADLKSNFALARDLLAASAVIEGADDGGRAAVLDAYHAALVPPFCLGAAKSFFDSH